MRVQHKGTRRRHRLTVARLKQVGIPSTFRLDIRVHFLYTLLVTDTNAIKTAVSAIDAILLEARQAYRDRVTDSATWAAFDSAVQPHLNTLTGFARRGLLDANATDVLRSTKSTLYVYRRGKR
jgi:hypothetical protein